MTSKTFRLRWDGKRYHLPAALRKRNDSRWVMTKRAEGLDLVPIENWHIFLEKVHGLENSGKKKDLIKFKIAPACEVDLQKESLSVPPALMHWAGLGQGDALLSLGEDSDYILPSK